MKKLKKKLLQCPIHLLIHFSAYNFWFLIFNLKYFNHNKQNKCVNKEMLANDCLSTLAWGMQGWSLEDSP
jgi:hypothetical protein